ncbi:hypothetical protein PSQ90_09980 [Devosia rhodophyticola]|uniref:DUF1269 domain-containing protein n=1 Tax=Devosia rhodophyticola TaxID=3026423 RepID=A0ABY7YTE5_9HYPH|nr:hypothetical protein [Devosia rhodophyticola]WDR04656.1 hypothetical protein PSQ90_09980 [Devosia rhodophyticola]
MRTVTALFEDYDHAASAVRALEAANFKSDEISLVIATLEDNIPEEPTPVDDEIADDAQAGVGIGAVVGGAGGFLAGLGALAIPGIGPVIAGGWLVATAIGAVTGAAVGGATGGIVGALTQSGVHEPDAHVLAEGIRRGGTVVSVRTNDQDVHTAEAIFDQAGRVDLNEKRAQFETTGWERFDPDAPAFVQDPLLGGRDLRNFPRRH